jgi:N-acetylneuraminic acid mutarotase
MPTNPKKPAAKAAEFQLKHNRSALAPITALAGARKAVAVWLVPAIIVWCASVLPCRAQVTGVIHYQGRLLAGATVFDGTGQFKFALVNSDASQTLWRSAPDTNNDGEPDQPVSVAVARGLYAVNLGDSTVANMAAIPLSVFTDKIGGLATDPLFLRVWFNDGVSGFQRLTPDQRISAVSFAMAAAHAQVAASVPDASITAAKLAPGALQAINTQIAALQTQVTTLAAQVAVLGGGGGSGPSGGVLVSSSPADAALLDLGYASFTSVAAPAWVNGTADNAPSPRSGHAAVWVPSLGQMFVWGGQLGANTYSAAGGLYGPNSDQWQQVPPVGAPEARLGHTLIWSGTEALIWGGFSASGFLNTGGRFDPVAFAWQVLSTQTAPAARDGHVAVWLAPSMIIWGGRNSSGLRNDGAIYNPAADLWTALTLPNPPEARSGASAVLANDRILIWGGNGAGGALNTGAQLIFQLTPSVTPLGWQTIATLNSPAPRTGHTTVMAGAKMIVWGGKDGGTLLGDGAIYDPAADTWQPMPSANSPSPRSGHVAVWTGEEMLVFGGQTASGPTATGGAYNPTNNLWRALTLEGNPVPRTGATAVWTGAELAVFGGQSGLLPVAALQRLTPQPTWYFYRKL